MRKMVCSLLGHQFVARVGMVKSRYQCRRCGAVDVCNTPPIITPATGVGDPVELLRRIANRDFMDMEGLSIICGDFISKWDCRNSLPNADVDAQILKPNTDMPEDIYNTESDFSHF